VHILRNRGRLAATAAAAVLPLVLLGAGLASTASATPKAGLPPIKHVWVIELENEGYQQSFGTPSADPYLATTLPKMGVLLKNYYGIGHASADNYIAQISGQAPDTATQNDCGVWTKFEPTSAGRHTCRTWATAQAGTTPRPPSRARRAVTPSSASPTTPRAPRQQTTTFPGTRGSCTSSR